MKTYSATCSQSLAPSWWEIYTEALCNSRGYQTDFQVMVRQTAVFKAIKRDIEQAVFAIDAVRPTL